MDSLGSSPSAVALRSIWAVLLLSAQRLIRSKFLWANLGLAAVPVAIACLWSFAPDAGSRDLGDAHALFGTLLRTLHLHIVVFFVANIFGFAVMRQELDDHTLHYLVLQPTGRWVLVLGKLVACTLLASALCVASLWIAFLVMILPRFGLEALARDLFIEGWLSALLKGSLVVILGLLAYTTIAMLMGSFFKSGLYGLLFLAWEAGLPYLPSTMKHWTIMHYLQSLLPETATIEHRIFEMLGDPAPVWMCLTVIGAVALVFTGVCTLLFQFRECLYTET
jgi:ABC-type transport system involved in multi-copper enzyme maturation permease subunit